MGSRAHLSGSGGKMQRGRGKGAWKQTEMKPERSQLHKERTLNATQEFGLFFPLKNETPLKDFKQGFKCQKNHYNTHAEGELGIGVE